MKMWRYGILLETFPSPRFQGSYEGYAETEEGRTMILGGRTEQDVIDQFIVAADREVGRGKAQMA
jgi:hypothetical protein